MMDARAGRVARAVHGFAVLLFFTLLAGDFWRYSISWWGWGVLIGLLFAATVVWLIALRAHRTRFRFRSTPTSLMAFLGFVALSTAWSFYPGVSALTTALTWVTAVASAFLAFCLDWHQILRALGTALRLIMGLSILFELVVSIFVRQPLLPFWVHYDQAHIPKAFFWSRDLLFHGGQIQGIVGNSNLLSMAALLALIVFGIQLADRTVRRPYGIAWLVVAAVVFGLSRSSTVILATVFVAVVLMFALWARRINPTRRTSLYASGLGVVIVAVAAVIVAWEPLLKLLGKSDDLTGRVTIWQSVIDLASQRPAFGWGWTGYWAPWVEPFHGLAVRHGVAYLQAHHAWLDVWMQLGIVGLIIFIALVLGVVGRSWFTAVDRPRTGRVDDQPFTAITLLPLLLIAALIAQSATESRMLIEGGLLLLVMLSLKTKVDRP